jgi:signal transduction histidine kinase
LVNAVYAIESSGKIVVKTNIDENNAYIRIIDDGCGISKDDLSKITDPFFTTKPPGEGTGLGLSITYNIISEHNGSIEFESELNKGTVVNVILPLHD